MKSYNIIVEAKQNRVGGQRAMGTVGLPIIAKLAKFPNQLVGK